MAARGLSAFDEYYAGVYGSRWVDLRASLLSPVRQVARVNRFADPSLVADRARDFKKLSFCGLDAYEVSEAQRLEPRADSQGLFDFYILDPASIFPAVCVQAAEGEEVLDLCAAPGGKSLILAEALGENARLRANELSDRRRARLRAVLEDYLPKERLARVEVTAHDASRWCLYEKETCDRILLDAPCSGERHLLADSSEMAEWSKARSKNLNVRQYTMLVGALDVLKPGGRVVYSTCSISPTENDEVIARVLKKRKGLCRTVTPAQEIGESTEQGWAILPDRTGYGPIYFSVLEKE